MNTSRFAARAMGAAPGRVWPPFVLCLVTSMIVVSARAGELWADDLTLYVFGAVACLPIVTARVAPTASVGAVVAVNVVQLVAVNYADPAHQSAEPFAIFQPIPLALMGVMWVVSHRMRPQRVWVLAGISSATVATVSVLVTSVDYVGAAVNVITTTLLVTLIGTSRVSAREARRQRAAEHERRALDAVRGERLAIARDIHDGVAHNVVLIKAQASVASYLFESDPGEARRALASIADQAQSAIDDLAMTLAVLRETDDDGPVAVAPPTPGIDDLGALIDRMRHAGTDVSLDESGEPLGVSPYVSLAAYRIVQESMTNAAKHARGAHVSVTLRWSSSALTVRITNGRGSAQAAPASGTGHGLRGMRERAETAGGTLHSGRTAAGGFTVSATLPVTPTPPTRSLPRQPQGDVHV